MVLRPAQSRCGGGICFLQAQGGQRQLWRSATIQAEAKPGEEALVRPDLREADPGFQEGQAYRNVTKMRRKPLSGGSLLCPEKPLREPLSEMFFLGNNTCFSSTSTNKNTQNTLECLPVGNVVNE